MIGREGEAAMSTGVGLRLPIIGKGEIEKRPFRDLSARGLHRIVPPGSAPAVFNLRRKLRGIAHCHAAPQQRPEYSVHQSPRPAIHQRQGGRDQCMIRRAKADLLREREPQDHPSLAVVGQPLPRGAVDPRVEVGKTAQALRRRWPPRAHGLAVANCGRAGAAASSVCPRRRTASSICKAARRAPTPSTLGMSRSDASSWRDETPEAPRRPSPSQPFAASAQAAAARRANAAGRRGEAARPNALRRLGEEGHRDRFLDALRLAAAGKAARRAPGRHWLCRQSARRPRRRSACRCLFPRQAGQGPAR